MNIQIRQEIQQDIPFVQHVIREAFTNEPFSDQSEHLLVSRLRNSKEFIPKLSLVAVVNDDIVGHILFSKLSVIQNENKIHEGLALAPVSVSPAYQKMGVGTALIKKGHSIARSLGFPFVILVGHEHYYLKFGYKHLKENISFPFDVPRQNCFGISFFNDALTHISGTIQYDEAFLL
ncbi:MAG: N-acetyltransferase [Saprospiraceae bacterium]|nr:N-acetyltransferase [Bacteroidia bacterium]NNE15237.1 N-acetyltransferase [Saprospiraceae bacterium]NNL92155.1 N-acetyltransferase [Saprospiraceae bacterium]